MAGTVPRPPAVPSRRRAPAAGLPGRRIGMLVALLGLLAVGCVIALRDRADANSRPVADTTPTRVVSPPTTDRRIRDFSAAVGDRAGCQQLAGVEPQLSCPIPNGTVVYIEITGSRLSARYRVVAGADDGVAARGQAACATGGAEERAWARPSAPESVAGRYACRAVGARADLWWTVDDAHLLGHAARDDGDLAALFTWWRAQVEHP